MIARSPCLSSPSLPPTNPSRNTHPSPPPSIPRKPPSSLPLRHHPIIKASGSSPSSTGKKQSDPMTISPSVRISDRNLTVRGFPILSSIPDTLVSTPTVSGIFLGADFPEPASRHVVSLGILRNLRFMSCFRFKLWWMAQKMGDKGSDVPNETQFILIESLSGDEDTMCTMYTVFLPLVDGSFRACLNGTPGDDLELCLESGDARTSAAAFSHAVFVGAAESDPFAAITSAVCAVESHLKTFRHRTEKRLPGIVDYFGWCTWDAFYQDVSQEGVEAGLRSLSAGGAPPKFVIIDDGWQTVDSDEIAVEADKPLPLPLPRLIGIKENSKFQSEDDPAAGINTIVSVAKEKYGVKYVYVWHALAGYWGGVRPGVKAMEEFGSVMQYPKISPGVAENEPWMMNDPLTVHGLGLVNPKSVYKFYNEIHGYLAAAGVDGVKVDVQCVLETLGAGFGGRVELTKRFHQALDASIAKNFQGNDCIACMSHNTDALYCSKQTAIVRASDDFYPRDPVSHTIHIASVAYNSVFLGEFMLPDWDMFHSSHPAAEYHASARAISGGLVYVSDAPGKHNFNLLRKLVLPDGSILRARLPGRPTRDCLFTDPARDGVSLLKIWNMNKYTGVLGVYNCQGAAWSSIEKKNAFHHTGVDALTCAVKGSDVHLIEEAATDSNWNGNCAVYNHSDGTLIVLPHDVAMPVSLKVLEHEVYTVTPIKVLASGFRFAPLGLVDMFNAGGAIEDLSYHVQIGAESLEVEHGLAPELNRSPSGLLENRGSDAVGLVCMEVKGCGRLGAFSSTKPRKCLIGASDVEFSYDPSSGFLFFQIEKMPEGDHKVHRVVIEL